MDIETVAVVVGWVDGGEVNVNVYVTIVCLHTLHTERQQS